jgi:hypothetical protein
MPDTHEVQQLSSSDRTRLARILGMLGSDHVGERAAAGLAAHRLVQRAGVTWYDVIKPPPHLKEPPISTSGSLPWREIVEELLVGQPELLPDWELNFLLTIRRRSHISQKQTCVLDEIVERVVDRRTHYAGR